MTRFVLDASAGVELLLDTRRGRSIAAQLPADADWWTPEHYFLEVASVLRRLANRGVITITQADGAFRLLERSVFSRAQLRPLLADAWGRRETMTVADALYVELARHLGATLVTADERLSRAPSLGVSVVSPKPPMSSM